MARKKNKEEDLLSGNINLLPETMRTAEQKAKKATASKEKQYQLRAPKKLKRRRSFSWLPFFGGPHWDAQPEVTPSKPGLEPEPIASVVRHPETKPSNAPVSDTSSQFGEDVSRQTGLHVLPGVSKASKGRSRIRFPRIAKFLGFSKASSRYMSHGPSGYVRTPYSKDSGSSRHYSLLDSKKSEQDIIAPVIDTPASDDINIPTVGTISGGIKPVHEKKTTDSEEKKAHRKWSLPRWLDVFHLIGLFTPKSRVKKQKKVKFAMEKAPSFREELKKVKTPSHPETPESLAHDVSKDAATPESVVMHSTISAIHDAKKPEPKKKKTTWNLPKWLDIFNVLKWLNPKSEKKSTKKTLKKPQVVEMPLSPISTQPSTPEAPTEKTISGTDKKTPDVTEPLAAILEEQKKAPKKKKASWNLPKWMDIFYLFGLLSKSKKKSTKKTLKKPQVVEMPLSPISTQPSTPEAPTEKTISGTDKKTPDVTEPLAAILEEQKKAPKKKKASWNLPKWMDIFYLFGLLSKSKKKKKIKPHTEHKESPKPPIPVPGAPMIEEKPVEQLETPKAPVLDQSIAPIASDAAHKPETKHEKEIIRDITPPVFDKSAPDTPEAPKAPEGAPKHDKKRKRKKFGKFHMPDKGAFGNAPAASIVNLIPAKYAISKTWTQLIQIFGLATLSTLGLIAIAYVGLDLWQKQLLTRTTEIDKDIQMFRDELLIYDKVYEPQMTALGDRIALIDELLDRHIYWTNFFELLEKYTLPEVYYDGVSATTNGSLSISAHGKGIETVSRTLLLLQSEEAKEFVTEVVINSASISENEIDPDGDRQADYVQEFANFSIGLTLNPKLFFYGDAE